MSEVAMAVDGEDHIRLYHRGNTELGRRLSDFYIRPFQTEFGQFNHLYGFGVWLMTGRKNQKLRELPPHVCVQILQQHKATFTADYIRHYGQALAASLLVDPELGLMLRDSTLPILVYREKPGDLAGAAALSASYYTALRHRMKLST